MGYEFDVVIAGGGPVGLALVCELRRAGVSTLVLERRMERDLLARAGSMGPLAFEALERLGLGDELLRAEQETLASYARMFREWAAATGKAAGDNAAGSTSERNPLSRKVLTRLGREERIRSSLRRLSAPTWKSITRF